MKKRLSIVLSALLIAGSFAACSGVKTAKDNEVITKLDSAGKAYVEVTGKNGESVTGKDGETATSYLSASEIKRIEENSSKKEEKSSSEAGKSTAAGDTKTDKSDKTSKKDEKNDKKENGTTADPDSIKINEKVVSGIDPEMDLTASSEELKPKGTTIKKTTLWEDFSKKTLSSGKFTIDMSVKSGTENMPMKLVFDKDKNRMYADVSTNGIQLGILMMDDKTYLLLPNLFTAKVYMEYDEAGSMEDMFDSFGSMTDSDKSSYVGSSKVKDGKVTYTCEEYKTADGATVKYYFDGKDWKRYEMIDGEDIVIYEINSVSNKVDDSVFSLKGYTKMDTDKLAKLMGNLPS